MRLSNPIAAAGMAIVALSAPSSVAKRASKLQFAGINESGPEFGEGTLPGQEGKDYVWPTLSTIDTFISKGVNTFRVNTLMERMVPSKMTGSFNETYMAKLDQTVSYITGKGAYAMIVPHNYGRYYGNIITSTSDFQTFWKNVAARYKSNGKVIFDTNNEYHDMAGSLVASLNQAAINGVRAAGATNQYITVEGNAYTGAWTWTTQTGTDGKTNAQTMGSLTDSSNKIIYQMHQYLDSDGSGTSATYVNSTIFSTRLAAATNWLRSNKKIGMIGEFAGGVNSVCEAAVQDGLKFIDANTDVWKGALWWAAGPWWGNYMFSVEPTSGPAYSTYIPILQQYF